MASSKGEASNCASVAAIVGRHHGCCVCQEFVASVCDVKAFAGTPGYGGVCGLILSGLPTNGDFMRHIITTMSLVLLVTVQMVHAQYPTGAGRGFGSGSLNVTRGPSFSPYLNLLRRGNSTLGNYYGLVRPELEFRDANAQFQAGFGQIDRRFSQVQRGLDGRQMQVTGHRVQFLSNLRGASGGGFGQRRAPSGGQTSAFGPTGHSAVFGNNGSWFSGFGPRRSAGQ